MARERTGIDIGHEVTIGGVTHLELLDNGRTSVSVSTYNFPFFVDATKAAKAPDKLNLTGQVTRVDDEDGKAIVGRLVTAESGFHQGMETRPAGAWR
ncbi:hypothetical protein [Mesorhizobium sp.]|uniref:hypothetical protein n=1 Tax=Mesorhizobium sp. TaxID=1871066 RepID=UPI000FE6B6EB|nr:hypothetical protein [Mesorhizobium sp.]RWC28420.1 MAG: hypothetical protein EOS27_18850 [Mesorhizobium sp.]TIX23195.1 MAG: hypothetical protein E5V35_23145 [Mesorhizobium sp.]